MKISEPKHKTKKKKRNISNENHEKDFSVKGRIWISRGEETFLGYGRVVLLERIRDYGSITKAAKSMGMSYRNAWELVASMNKLSEEPLVDRFTGGKGGGGTVLTKPGEKAIAMFWKLHSDLSDFLKNSKIIFFLIFFLIASAGLLPNIALAKEKETILVAAASNLQFAMDAMVRLFEKKKPDKKVKIIFGSSGNFFNQIINGAPFDLLFSADLIYPKEIKNNGLGKEVTIYAFGRMVVMTPRDSGIESQKMGLKSLFHPSVKKIAIANPDHAPYGRAAVAYLRGQNMYEKLREKLVMGENISQAAQFVESGAAEAGIIALSLAIKAKEVGRAAYWEIPAETYPSLEQGFIILNRTKRYSLVTDFTDFVQSREGREVLLKYGFNVP